LIRITQDARHELKRILSSKVDNSYARLRLIDRGNGHLGLGIDVELPSDHVVEHEGSGLLVVDRELASSLTGVVIDVENTAEGVQLIISESS